VSEAAEDFSQPVLPGPGGSDYERYLRTDALLSLQKGPGDWVHRDELLFQTTHQSSELGLKLACADVDEATRLLERREVGAAIRLLRRAVRCIELITDQIHMLEHMSPWEYQEIRRVLGHGSGFDSPGFNAVRHVSPGLGQAFDALVAERGLTVVELYRQGRQHEDLYQVAELLTDWDERIAIWRQNHLFVIERVIGGDAVGTQGTPVELVAKLLKHRYYPELWQARNRLTELAKAEGG
jgi:tryptophan 2,3-dioxygenase